MSVHKPVRHTRLKGVPPLMVFMALTLMGCAPMKIGGMSMETAFPQSGTVQVLRAALRHDFKLADALIQHGVDLNSPGTDGILPLIWVMQSKNLDALDYLLGKGMDPNQVDGKIQRPPVMYAAWYSDRRVMETLLRHGAKPDLADRSGNSALSDVVARGWWPHAELLLHYGADINRMGRVGPFEITLGEAAASTGRFKTLDYLLDHGYTRDLEGLAEALQTIPYGAKGRVEAERLLRRLRAMGVKRAEGKGPSMPS